MSGVAVIRYLLANAAAVTAIVPSTRIMAGDLPINTTLPAIAITQVSGLQRLTVAMTETPRLHTDRVQVSVICKGPQTAAAGTGYAGVNTILKLVLAACPNQNGTINTFAVDSILPDVEGPDLQDDATSLFSRSRDFIVKWRA